MLIKVQGTTKRDYTGPRLPRTSKLLGVVAGYLYFYIPDDQVPEGLTAATMTTTEIKALKAVSPAIQHINTEVQTLIRAKYSVDEEMKCLRLGKGTEEFTEYAAYVKTCVASGKTKKAKLGL